MLQEGGEDMSECVSTIIWDYPEPGALMIHTREFPGVCVYVSGLVTESTT